MSETTHPAETTLPRESSAADTPPPPRDEDSPPAEVPTPRAEVKREEPPLTEAPRTDAPRTDAPRTVALPDGVAPADTSSARADAPREESPPADASARGTAAPTDAPSPRGAAPREETPPADDAVAARAAPREDTPPAAAPRDDSPPADAPREDRAPTRRRPARRPRATTSPPVDVSRKHNGRGRDDEISREDLIHQPTVEYTPFQTDEHELPEAPLGSPRDDEPRLVAARGIQRDDDDDGEIHAYATKASHPDTAEHDVTFDTGEHHAPEETEQRPPAPLRKAPTRAPDAPVARRRPAPNAPRGRGRSRPPKTPKGPRPSGGAHWGRRIFALVALVVIIAALYVVNATFQPFHGDGEGRVAVTIPENSDAAAVGKILEEQGVIDSARFFELHATISGDRGDLRPGRYNLKKGMKNGAVIDALTTVPETTKAVETVDVTLIEGPSRKENAPVVDDSGKVEGDYARASSSKATLRRIRELGAPKGTKTAEGFLFPATYTLNVDSSANELVKQQLDAYEENFKQVDMKYAKRKNLSRYDVLIIASMIEREAQLARERSLVSAVIYNRLKEGMPLGIDATIRYSTNNWQRPIRQSELDRQEPYNTRLNRGLPPTPIGNPGLASLKAAAKPANKNYLFYVRKPGKSGEHAFSSTDAQFERDRQKYQASRGDG